MKKLKLFSLLMLLFVGVTSMWADQVTSVANIVSGQKYYIGSTKSNSTDYYLQVTGRGATTGKVKGTAVTSKDDADLFTFTQVTGGWTIQFENGKYLVLPNAKDNGKVYVQADAGSWTLADASSLISFKYGDFYLKNNQATNTTNFGMYASGQLDLWLEPAATASTPKVSYEQPTGGTLLLKHGETNLASGDEVEADEEVTIIATPGEGYKLPATISFKDGENQDVDPDDLTFIENDDKNGGAFLMPNYDLTVAASFTAKAVSAVTVNNPEHGEITVTGAENLAAVMEGTELTVNIDGSGYTFSLKYKEGEGEWKALENGGVITMPAQALTITADEAEITSPFITPSVAKVDFGAVVKDASVDAVEFNIEGNYLTEGNLSVSLLYGTAFEVAPASVPVNGALSATKITVTAKSTATAGTFEDILVISGGGLANNVELDVVLTVQELHTATWFVNGENIKSQNAVAGTALEIPAPPTTLAEDCADLKFRGWVTAPIASPLDEAPEYVTTEGLVMGDADANYYAVFATEKKEEIDGDPEWVATAFADLATNDSIVVTYAKSSVVYALPNNEGTSSSPDAAVVTVADGKLSAEPAATLRWKAVKNGDNIQFATGTSFLYCTNSNDGVRVGSGTANVFSIKDNYIYTSLTTDARYVGVNGTQDWRCYKSINSNIQDATLAFYKKTVSKQEVTSYIDFRTTCPSCKTVTLLKADAEHGSFILKQNGVEVTAPVKTCDAAEITIEATPNPGCQFKFANISTLSGASISGTTITLEAGTEGELTVSASFAQNDYKVVLSQTGDAEAELTGAKDNAHYGEEITVTASAVDGFYFIGWEASPAVTFADAKAFETTFTMPNSNVTVTAKYAKILSVAEAIALIDAESTIANQVVEGYVSSIYSSTVTSGGQISYYIQDVDENGFLTGTEFEAYNGKGLNGAVFTEITNVKVGAKVRIFGNLKKYKTTYEFDSNNYQLSYVEAANPSVVVYGDATKKNYYYNEDFEFTGLKAKQVFENGYAVEIASPNWAASPAKVTATGNVAVTATYADVTSAPYNVEVTKQLRELDSDDLRWSSYDTENILLGYSETPAVRSVINKYNLPVTYRSGDGSVMSVNAETGVITPKASGFASMFVEFEGNEEYAAYNASYAVYVFGYSYIAVSGEATKTAYEAGEKFSFEGLTATAVYTLGEQDPKQVNVTDAATWNASPEYVTADGNIAVTATWQEKTNEPVNVAVTVNKHKVTITTPENGKLSIMHGVDPVNSGDAFVKGTVLNIEVSPAIGYKLATLTVNGNDVKAEKQFEIGTESQYEVVATFIPKAAAGIEWKDPEYGTKAYEGYLRVQGDKIVESDLPVLDNPNGLSIVYSSENTAVAEIDPATGVITPKAEGYTTISATFAGDDDYLSATVNYVLTVAIDQLEFYVIGSFNGWSEFVPVYDWYYEFENLTPGDYQLKVTTAPNWSEAYGYDALTVKSAGLSKDGDGNICFTISNESEMKFVSVEFEKNEEGLSRFAVIGTYAKPTFTVVGVEALVGYNWGAGLNEVENEMLEELSTGNYELEKEDVMLAAGDYEYQVAKDHKWRDVSNSTLTITESGRYNVTFTFVPSTGATSAVAELIEPIVILPTMKIAGDWDVDLENPSKWNENELIVAGDEKTATYTATNLVKDEWYHFWIIKSGVYISGNNGFDRENLSKDLTTYYTGEGAYAMYFQADKDGDYTFTWTYETNVITMTFPYKEATALDNTEAGEKAEKVMQNGQLLIIKNGKTFNAQGAVVK